MQTLKLRLSVEVRKVPLNTVQNCIQVIHRNQRVSLFRKNDFGYVTG